MTAVAKNAGYEGAVIVDKVSELPAGEGLNSANGEWGNMIDMGVPKNTQLEDAIAAATAGAQGGGMY